LGRSVVGLRLTAAAASHRCRHGDNANPHGDVPDRIQQHHFQPARLLT
jgi:hypothetical protein